MPTPTQHATGEPITLWLHPTTEYATGRQLHGHLEDATPDTLAVRHSSGRLTFYPRRLVRSLIVRSETRP